MYPAGAIEFGLVGEIETQSIFVGQQPEDEPALLLADAKGFAIAANEFVGQTIAQPVAGYAQYFDVIVLEAYFFMQLAKHGVDGLFAFEHAALRKLPAFGADTTTQQQLVVCVRKNDTDVCPKTVGVNPIVAHSNLTETPITVYFTLSTATRPRRLFIVQRP